MALRKRRSTWLALAIAAALLLCWGILFSSTHTDGIDSYAQCALAGNLITESDPPVCHDGARYFVGPRTSAQDGSVSAPVQNTAFQILVDGDSAGDYPREQLHISNQPSWESYWSAIHRTTSQQPPLIPVSFTASDVVAISQGQKTTNGYTYKITAVTVGTRGSIVDIVESIPTVTCTVSNHPTNRYFIVRTAKLTDPVSYRTTTEYRHC